MTRILPLALSLALLPAALAGNFRFVDVAEQAGVAVRNVCGTQEGAKGWLSEEFGAGAAWLDYDNDGNLDLYVVNGSGYGRSPAKGEPNRLFRGNGKGGFTDVTAKAGVGHSGWGYGVAVADVDGDGDPDLYVTNYGPNVLYLNDGDGSFTEASSRAGVAGDSFSTAAAFFDQDGDGDLDLYVGNYMVADPNKVPRAGTPAARKAGCQYKGIDVTCGPLGQVPLQDVFYRNNGDGTFKDDSAAAGIRLGTPRFTLGVVAADFDNDGRVDLYVANDSVQNSLWKNQGDGTFKDVGLTSLAGLNGDGKAQAGMGTDAGDLDDDGFIDLAVTNFAHDLNTVYRNMQGKVFLDESSTIGLQPTYMALSWGTGWYDFDHDGDVDLFIANGHVYPEVDQHDLGTTYRQSNHLFDNGGRRLTEVSGASGPGLAIERSFRGTAFGDYDNDGDVDLFVTALDDKPVLLDNRSTDGRTDQANWAQFRLRGKSPNTDAIGARLKIEVAGRTMHRQVKGGGSYLSAHDPRIHVGLGAARKVNRVTVTWPDGTQTVHAGLDAGRVHDLKQK